MATKKTQKRSSSKSGKTTKNSNTGARKTKSTNSKKRLTNSERGFDSGFIKEFVLWIIVAVSLFLFISNFGFGGIAGNIAKSIMMGIFGTMGYLFPVLLLAGSFFMVSNKDNPQALKIFIGTGMLCFSICSLCSLISIGFYDPISPSEAYAFSNENIMSGGFVGGLFTYYLVPLCGKFGTYIFDFVLMIISLVMITGKSAMNLLKTSSVEYYESAKVREQERRERTREMRMDRRQRGVSADITLVKDDDSDEGDEMKEITLSSDALFTGFEDSLFDQTMEDAVNEDQVDLPFTEGLKVSKKTRAKLFTASPALEQEAVNATENMPKIRGLNSFEESDRDFDSYTANDYTGQNSDVYDENDLSMQAAETSLGQMSSRRPKPSADEISAGVAEVANEINENAVPVKEYVFPPKSLLKLPSNNNGGDSKQHLLDTASKLTETLKTFGVKVTVTNISCGPSVTRYEIQPEMGVKVSKIVGLTDDIKLNLAAADIRIEAPIPGKAAVGIEVPNKESIAVSFRELVDSAEFNDASSNISFAVGRDIAGKVKVADIGKMPHLLIAGATGSGKSVCINTIIMSILYKAKPDEVKLIMIDPKVVELSVYNGIPHLLIPVVTDPKKAAGALNWAVSEMTERYQKFAECNVRDIKGYNQKIDNLQVPDSEKPEKMPQIVIIVDELADLMMVASGDVEEAICRLAQLARAAGIHLIIATQRPSVNVITGLIKANMPSRIAFAVSSGIDSRTILDMVGAERLLGKGDMLFYPQGIPKPLRIQGAFVTDQEVAEVVDFIKENNTGVFSNEKMDKVLQKINTLEASSNKTVEISSGTSEDGRDSYFMEAAKIIIDKDKASIGMLQRFLKVGFNRAARIMDQLEEAGVVGPEEGTKPRKVLMSPEEFEQFIDECS